MHSNLESPINIFNVCSAPHRRRFSASPTLHPSIVNNPKIGICAHLFEVLVHLCGVRSIDMDNSQEIACASTAIGRVDIVPTLLKVLCGMTGMRCDAWARGGATRGTASCER